MKRGRALAAALLLVPLLVRLLLAQSPAPPPPQAPPPPTFTLTDLGPLGLSAAPSGATALNASGQVTGFRFENFPSSVCFAAGGNRAFLWNNGAYTELGTLGGASSFAYGINSAGQIVGSSDPCPNGIQVGQRAFIWQNGSMIALDPSTSSNDSSIALAINDSGSIAGYINGTLPVIWKAATIAASPGGAVRSNNVVTITATTVHNFAVGDSVTIGGVADASFDGNFTIASVPSGATFTYSQAGSDAASGAGTAWDRVALTALACQFGPPNCQAKALAINDSGQAAGWGLGPFVTGPLGSYNANQAVMWDANGQPTGLGSLGNFFNDQANAMNSKGDVVGYSQIDGPTVHAVLWQNGNPQNPQDLGAIPGIDPLYGVANITDTNSSAWGVNSKGNVVGVSGAGTNIALQGSGGRAFLYTNGQVYDLLSLLAPGTNWRRLEVAWAINDNGMIVGLGIDANQQEHGFLLTPVITQTTISISSTANPSVFGQAVNFTATVSPATSSPLTPTGNVTFSDGGTALGTVASSSGTAIFSSSALAVGAHAITASYAGDNNFAASTSSGVNQVVSQAATSTALAASPNPANVGQSVTFTVTVTPFAPGAGTPTGTVNFLDGGSTLGMNAVNNAGNATFTTSSLGAGSHGITANYSGDANFAGNSSTSSITVTVQGPPPPVQIIDNEAIHVADAESFPDVLDAEAVHVADTVFVTPLIQVSAAVAEFSAGSLGFGGQSGSQTITVSDIGQSSLTIASATISAGSQFTVTQLACSNGAISLATVLPPGGVCTVTIRYTASVTPLSDNAALVFTDNAALGNLATIPAGSNFTQSVSLSGSGTTTGPPPPPPAVIPIMDNETIHVTDAESFPDVFDAEAVHVADTAFVTPLIQVSAPVAQFSAGALGFNGQSGSQTIAVSDIGTTSMTVASATVSGSSQFAITFITCSNDTTSLSTTLPSGGACILTIGYSASPTPANDNGALVFTDNAALSNVASAPSGSNYTQSIPLSGSGSKTPPPPPPPAVIPIPINETVHVTDTESFPDAFDPEQIHVTDQISLIPCDFTVSAASPLNLSVGGSGSTPITIASTNGCNLQVSMSTTAANSGITISLPSTATTNGSSTSATLTVNAGPSVTPTSFTVTVTGTAGLTHSASVNVNVAASISGTAGVVQTLLNVGAISSAGIANALTSKLSAAQSAPNAQTSINTVKAFQNQVQAQTGKSISTSFTLSGVTFNPANTLIGDGQGLINAYRAGTVPDPITGYVVDANGGGVAGASVSVADANGAVAASATSDVTGFYFMATTGILVPGANYTIRVSGLPSGFTSGTPSSQSFTWRGVTVAFTNFVLD